VEGLQELAINLDADALLQFTGADHVDRAPGVTAGGSSRAGTRIPAVSVFVDRVRS
jgi:hypothetical protein